MNRGSQNDAAWQRVYADASLGLLSEIELKGYAYVSADQLKTIGGREPRLMAKIDTLSARPDIFKQHSLTIFPVENGRYIIFSDPKQAGYFRIREEMESLSQERYCSPWLLQRFQTYPHNQHFSETQAIDFACISLLLQTFVEDEQLSLTLRGRLRSGEFFLTLPDGHAHVQISGVQIEVDSGYESERAIYLIEAKIGKRDDFHIRQLLYPYLEWSQRSTKAVVPILLIYSNGLYYFFQFEFQQRFGEMRIVKKRCYSVEEAPRLRVKLSEWLRRAPTDAESPPIPFPQADDLDTVVEVVHVVADGRATKAEIAEAFEFDERQGDYYANAAIYLGLLERQKHEFRVSASGQRFIRMTSRNERTAYLLEQVLKHPIFRDIITLLCTYAQPQLLFRTPLSPSDLPSQEIARVLLEHLSLSLSNNTATRRVATIRSWMKWFFKNCDVI